MLRDGGSALDAAEKATIVLEDAGETNAGFGSNLTESGTLEMDAGLMDGSNLLFGAVGAITEIKNPIRVARKLVDEQARGRMCLLNCFIDQNGINFTIKKAVKLTKIDTPLDSS